MESGVRARSSLGTAGHVYSVWKSEDVHVMLAFKEFGTAMEQSMSPPMLVLCIKMSSMHG